MTDNWISQSSETDIGIAPGTTDATMDSDSDPKTAIQQQEVELLYLDFDTDLPTPVLTSGSSQQEPPQPPNLTPYTSPFLWSKPRKTVITIISCCVTALSAYAAGEYTPPSNELMARWGVGKVVYNLGITLFTLGFGIGPMVLASFSEINGRRPIFVASGLVFTGGSGLAWFLDLHADSYSLLDRMRCDRFLCWDARCPILPRYRGVYVPLSYKNTLFFPPSSNSLV